MTMQRQVLGKTGKIWLSTNWSAAGYAILARRYRTRHGEIDIVARDGETIVFVEVKAKESGDFGTAAACGHRREAAPGHLDGGRLSGAPSAPSQSLSIRCRRD